MRETHLDELLGVQRAVVVAALAHRPGQHHARGVDRLPDVLLVHPPRDLLDQHRSEPLRPQLLVHAEEVDLDHLDRGLVGLIRGARCLDVGRDARDEAHELAAGLHAHAEVPAPKVARRLQRPPEEGHGVVEAEHAVVVLDVVLAQQQVDLPGLRLVVDVHGAPLELRRQDVGLVPDLLRGLHLVDGPAVLAVVRADGGHRLRIPKWVRPLHVSPGLLADAALAQDAQELLLAAEAVARGAFPLLGLLRGLRLCLRSLRVLKWCGQLSWRCTSPRLSIRWGKIFMLRRPTG
mmetsp:Transcript_25394/g.80118  ORF Transcript_25394/g.80118 Transcript_25394/m.80118 type:complete len:291 (+) Transcript_25394:655-1527(+)